jgi:hypothetical protein
MGTHERSFEGKVKEPSQKIRLAFELPLAKHVFDKDKNIEEPHIVGKQYNYSMHENATFRLDLESWRGNKFSPERLTAFDPQKLLGHTGLVNIVHEKKDDGKIIAKIKAITPVVQGMTVPDPILKQILYTVDWGPDHQVFKELPEWLREEISKCIEWRPKTASANVDPGNPASGGNPPADVKDPF